MISKSCNIDRTRDIKYYIDENDVLVETSFSNEIIDLMKKSNKTHLDYEYLYNQSLIENGDQNVDKTIADTIVYFRNMGYSVEYKKTIIESTKNNLWEYQNCIFKYSITIDWNNKLPFWKKLINLIFNIL